MPNSDNFEVGVGALLEHRLAVFDFVTGPPDNVAELSRRLCQLCEIGERAERVVATNFEAMSDMITEATSRFEGLRQEIDSLEVTND